MKILLYTEANSSIFINQLIDEKIILNEDDFYKQKNELSFRTNSKVIKIAESLSGDDADCYFIREMPKDPFRITHDDWLVEWIELLPLKCYKKLCNGKINWIISNKNLEELQGLQDQLTKNGDKKYIIEESSFLELKGGSKNPYGVSMNVTLI